MLKVSHFLGQSEQGPTVIPLFGPADSEFIKTAAPSLRPDVVKYIDSLTPQENAQYVLVNAMGAGEFYGSNINGDHFPEAALIHRPDDWQGVPLIDKIKSKNWPYGYPTFYGAHPFAHHRNKNPARAFGEVELATWNPNMKRVELVCRVDKDKCAKFGGVGVWDKLRGGQFPDVSMGTKVPYDTCSICLDWDLYRKALLTYVPGKHKHPGVAVLAFHKKLKAKNGVGIRGLSITRKDYCEHARREMNRIYPDGRKVFVRNDFPRFFDISFVFIGADKTAKVMLFIKRSSAECAEMMGTFDPGQYSLGKVASVQDETLKMAFLGKKAKAKHSEIDKDVVPSQFAGKAVPLLTDQEEDLPEDVLKALGRIPIEKTLSTTAGMGIVLKPKEFQRIVMELLGKGDLAKVYNKKGIVFSKSDDKEEMKFGPDDFMPILARLLSPLMASRSALGPIIEKRVIIACGMPKKETSSATSHPSELLRKIGSAYNGYRSEVMSIVASANQFMRETANQSDADLCKLADASVEELFTPLTVSYLSDAFLNERSLGDTGQGVVKV